MPGNATDKTFTQFHACLVYGFLVQTLRGAKFERFGIAKEIDGAHLAAHARGDQRRDLVKTLLTRRVARHRIAQAAQQLA